MLWRRATDVASSPSLCAMLGLNVMSRDGLLMRLSSLLESTWLAISAPEPGTTTQSPCIIRYSMCCVSEIIVQIYSIPTTRARVVDNFFCCSHCHSICTICCVLKETVLLRTQLQTHAQNNNCQLSQPLVHRTSIPHEQDRPEDTTYLPQAEEPHRGTHMHLLHRLHHHA